MVKDIIKNLRKNFATRLLFYICFFDELASRYTVHLIAFTVYEKCFFATFLFGHSLEVAQLLANVCHRILSRKGIR